MHGLFRYLIDKQHILVIMMNNIVITRLATVYYKREYVSWQCLVNNKDTDHLMNGLFRSFIDYIAYIGDKMNNIVSTSMATLYY